MKDLTSTVPKPMLQVNGKSLIEHKLDALPPEVDEVILIIGYLGHVIRDTFGEGFGGRRMTYVEQETLNGTAAAVWLARPHIKDRFVVLMGDDLYARKDIESCMASPDWSVLVEKTESMGSGGKIVMDEQDHIVSIEEGSHDGPGLMNTNLMVLDTRIFEYPIVPKAPGSDEYGLPQTVLAASRASGIPLHPVPTTFWIQITAPDDLAKAERILSPDR